ncbi:MAG: hypothetical protein SNJ70_07645, partial [Armatimonadota bacterium]
KVEDILTLTKNTNWAFSGFKIIDNKLFIDNKEIDNNQIISFATEKYYAETSPILNKYIFSSDSGKTTRDAVLDFFQRKMQN